jgi:large subunit ribosomal protein L10
MVKESNVLAVDKLTKKAKDSDFVVMLDFAGVDVQGLESLRKNLRASELKVEVCKNTLVKIAFDNAGYGVENVDSTLYKGSSALIFSDTDPVAPSKIVNQFLKEFDAAVLKGGYFNKEFVGSSKVKELASLLSKDELIAKLLGSLQSPITGFVNVLSGNIRNLVNVLNAIKEDKDSAE